VPALDGRLHARGYTGTWDPNRPSGEPVLFTFEGLHDIDGGGLLKLAAGEAVPGMSGGPLLDLATGRVCGVVKTTRDARAPRGGWAVPVRLLQERHPDVWAAHDRFHEDDRRWPAVAERWAELAELLLEPPLPRPEKVSASYLLRSEFEVVPFRGRAELLDQLERWCQEPRALGVRLVTGPGGQGKSRLARQLTARMTSRGWLAGFTQENLSDVALERLRATSIPCLLVIDYAEGRPEQVARVVEVLLGAERAGPVRLLLLARAAGDWWAELSTSTPRLEHALEGTVEMKLPPLEGTVEGRQQAYADATNAFAEQLGRDQPVVPVADLADPRYGSVLLLHMAALAALLPAITPAGDEGTATVGDPTAKLLGHERRYWQRAAQAAGLNYDQVELARAVATATLCGANDEAQAAGLLERVPGLPGIGQAARLARLVRQLYPTRVGYWGGLQPDLLGEELVAQITADPVVPGGPAGLLAALLAEASEQQAHQALTVLARAAPRHTHLRDSLGPLLRADPDRLVLPAVRVATQAREPAPLVAALQQVLEVLVGRPLLEVVDRLPDHSVALGEFAVDATGRALDYHRAQAEPDAVAIAGLLNDLSLWLGKVGRREDALHAIEEAVRYYRELADADPGSFRSHLAGALNNLALRLGDVGRREDALRAIEEAVGYYRELADADPDAFVSNLATALGNLARRLRDVGRREDALRASREAVGYYQRLAQAAPEVFLLGFAVSLDELSDRLGDVGRRQDALTASQEAVRHYRRLAQAAPDAFLLGLADSLSSLSIHLSRVGRHEDAVQAAEEAVGYYRRLADATRDAFLPDLATALRTLLIELNTIGRSQEAARVQEELIRILQQIE